MKWRFFEQKDLNWILETARDMFEESEWKGEVKYETEKIRKYFSSAVVNPNIFAIMALGKDDEPIGFLTGSLMTYNFSNASYAREIDLYIVPSKRGGMTAVQMMKKFIDWAKAKGAKEVYFEPSQGVKKDFDKMAKRLNMDNISSVYRRKL